MKVKTPPRRLSHEIDEALGRREKVEKLCTRIRRLLVKWEPRLGVHVKTWQIKNAKTYWATMNKSEIWFSADLADMPSDFVEVIVVHELVHYLTDGHDLDFFELMNRHLPNWRRIYARYGRYDEVPSLYST